MHPEMRGVTRVLIGRKLWRLSVVVLVAVAAVGVVPHATARRPGHRIDHGAASIQQAPPLHELWSVPPGFALDRVVDGLYLPVNIAFVPEPGPEPEDPLYYIAELYGTIKVVQNNGQVDTYADNLLNFDPTGTFPGSGEQGVIGIAVQPVTGDVFVSTAYADAEIGMANKVVRFASSDGGLTSDEQTTLLDGIGPTGTAHQIQAVTFGPDGMVYVNVGDGGRSDENNNPSQDPDDLRGKVLRMTPDGDVPSDNPDPTSYVYAKGFRNPFGAAWRAADDTLYISGNGPASHDRLVKVEPEGNYGWCCDMEQGAIYLWPQIVAPTAMDFMEDDQFPSEYDGHLFVGSIGFTYGIQPWDQGKRIFRFELDTAGEVVADDEFIVYQGDGYSTVVGLAFGPNGLYFTDMYGEAGFDDEDNLNASVVRVRWVGPPDAVDVAAERFHVAPGDSVTVTVNVRGTTGLPVADGTVVQLSADGGTVEPATVATRGGGATAAFTAGLGAGPATLRATVDAIEDVVTLRTGHTTYLLPVGRSGPDGDWDARDR